MSNNFNEKTPREKTAAGWDICAGAAIIRFKLRKQNSGKAVAESERQQSEPVTIGLQRLADYRENLVGVMTDYQKTTGQNEKYNFLLTKHLAIVYI